VPAKATRDQAYEHLNLRVPDDVKCVDTFPRLRTLPRTLLHAVACGPAPPVMYAAVRPASAMKPMSTFPRLRNSAQVRLARAAGAAWEAVRAVRKEWAASVRGRWPLPADARHAQRESRQADAATSAEEAEAVMDLHGAVAMQSAETESRVVQDLRAAVVVNIVT
jgi:hypothetical protein